jgi:hypothetical protein
VSFVEIGHAHEYSLAVGKVGERALFVDDADRRLLGADAHALDVIRRLAKRLEPLMDDVSGLDGRLRVELGRVGDLEEHVLHHVRAERALELERLALEEHVVEAPRLCGEHRGKARLALLDEVGEVDGARARVACRPGFARASVGRVAVGAERLAVHPRLGDGVDGLIT